jgi:2-aminobenzoate-CoA ligase
MSPSAQIDRFVHDRLPTADQLPIFRYDLPELQLPDQLNLVEELLDKAAGKGFADKPMLRSPDRTLTYAQAAVEVNRIAQVLVEDLGMVPGNRVLLRGGNSIAMALAWLAAVKAGMIAVATMPLLRAKELGDILEKAQPSVALCDGALLDELRTAQQAHPALKTIIAFNQPAAAASLEARTASKSGVFRACPTASDDIALLAFTSGTTGKPKAPATSHRDVLAMC